MAKLEECPIFFLFYVTCSMETEQLWAINFVGVRAILIRYELIRYPQFEFVTHSFANFCCVCLSLYICQLITHNCILYLVLLTNCFYYRSHPMYNKSLIVSINIYVTLIWGNFSLHNCGMVEINCNFHHFCFSKYVFISLYIQFANAEFVIKPSLQYNIFEIIRR